MHENPGPAAHAISPASAPPENAGGNARWASPWWLLCLLPIFLSGLTLPLQSPDEPREAEIARAMYEGWYLPATLVSVEQARAEGWTLPPLEPGQSPAGRHVDGGWAVPHLAGRPFLEKPPLYYWTVCACFAVFGVNEFSARLPNALCGFLTCVLIYALVRRWRDAGTALLAAAMLATMHRLWEFSHTAMIDMVLTCSTTLAYLAYARWCDAFFGTEAPAASLTSAASAGGVGDAAVNPAPAPWPGSFRSQAIWSAVFWGAVGLAFLAKNMIGPILVLGGCGIHLLYACGASRRWFSPFVSLGVGLPLLALTCGPWLWALHASQGNDGLYELLWLNTFGRLNDAYGGHNISNPFFYVDNFFLLGAPWTVLLPMAGLWGACSWSISTPQARSRGVFLASWLIVATVLLSLSAGKRGVYLLPLLPGQAAAVAWLVMSSLEHRPKWLVSVHRWYLRVVAAVVLIALAGALVFALAPGMLDGPYNALKARRGMPRLEFPGPQWLYLPFGLASLAVGLSVLLHPRLRSASRVARWLSLSLAVGLFFLGVSAGGLLDFVFEHKTLDPFIAACQRHTGDRDLYLVYPGEKEKGYLAWNSRGRGVYETLGMSESVSIQTGQKIAFADAIQERIQRGRPALFLLPESSLGQFCQPARKAGDPGPDPVSFPTWPRHLFPVAVTAINDNWYWLLGSQLPVDAYSSRLRQAAPVKLLVHPSQAGFALTQGGRRLERIWSGEAILEALQEHPDLCLVVPEEAAAAGSAEMPILARIRAEWPVFDQYWICVETVRTGADLSRYNGASPLAGPTLKIFANRAPATSPTQP